MDTHYTNYDESYRDLFYFFSSNSCNFVHSPNRLKHDCPKAFVFCEKNGSKPVLIQKKMTFQTASNYCSNISSHICKLFLLKGANSHQNFEEISKAFKRNNLNDTVFKVWTGLEKVNLTHFRKSRLKYREPSHGQHLKL